MRRLVLAILLVTSPALAVPAATALEAEAAGAVADGVTDDAPALRAALARLGAGGGVLRLRAGTYALGAPLELAGDGVQLLGEGATLRALPGFAADAGPRALVRSAGAGRPADRGVQRDLRVVGLALDGAGVAVAGVWIERARDVVLRDLRVRGMVADGEGAGLVVRSADAKTSDTGEVRVTDSVVEITTGSGLALRRLVNCTVSGNRVEGADEAGGAALDLRGAQACTVSDNVLLHVATGLLADESNHLQVLGNYVYGPRVGFQAERANNNVFVNNRVLTGGQGFVVHGSGMMLVANYAAFLDPGPAIWVKRGGTHDAVVANNASVTRDGGIRFDASDGVVVGNVPTANRSTGIEVNGARVTVSANAVNGSPVGIRLGETAAACTVVGNAIRAGEIALDLNGRDHAVRANAGPATGLPERGPGAVIGQGTIEVREATTRVAAALPEGDYQVAVEWGGDPGGREWIAERSAAGFTLMLAAPPPRPVRARWLARAR